MGKIVEQKTCPTCGTPHPSGTVQKYEIPEVPVIEREALKGLETKLEELASKTKPVDLTPLETSIKEIKGAILDHTKPTRDFIKTFWEDCPDCKSDWLSIKKEIEDNAIKNAHVKFSKELIDHFESCPERKDEWSRFKGSPGRRVEEEPRSWWPLERR